MDAEIEALLKAKEEEAKTKDELVYLLDENVAKAYIGFLEVSFI